MSSTNGDPEILSKIFARTPSGLEQIPVSWSDLIGDLLTFGKTCNGFMTVTGDDGAGKTTFIKKLIERAAGSQDCLHISTVASDSRPGWLLRALTPWLSSSKDTFEGVYENFALLGESQRPILVCLDGGDISQHSSLSLDISSLMNLADASNTKMSVVIFANKSLISKMTEDGKLHSRIVFQASIPRFTDGESSEFILNKLTSAGLKKRLTENQLTNIVKQAGGVPARLIQGLATAFGHRAQATKNVPIANEKHFSLKESKQDAESAKRVSLEDLLAPRKN